MPPRYVMRTTRRASWSTMVRVKLQIRLELCCSAVEFAVLSSTSTCSAFRDSRHFTDIVVKQYTPGKKQETICLSVPEFSMRFSKQ